MKILQCDRCGKQDAEPGRDIVTVKCFPVEIEGTVLWRSVDVCGGCLEEAEKLIVPWWAQTKQTAT